MSIFSYLALSGVCQCSFFPPPLIYIHYCFWAWLRGVRIGFSLGRSQVSYSLSSTFFDYCYRNLGFPQPTPVLRVICIIATAPPPPYYQFVHITPAFPSEFSGSPSLESLRSILSFHIPPHSPLRSFSYPPRCSKRFHTHGGVSRCTLP